MYPGGKYSQNVLTKQQSKKIRITPNILDISLNAIRWQNSSCRDLRNETHYTEMILLLYRPLAFSRSSPQKKYNIYIYIYIK